MSTRTDNLAAQTRNQAQAEERRRTGGNVSAAGNSDAAEPQRVQRQRENETDEQREERKRQEARDRGEPVGDEKDRHFAEARTQQEARARAGLTPGVNEPFQEAGKSGDQKAIDQAVANRAALPNEPVVTDARHGIDSPGRTTAHDNVNTAAGADVAKGDTRTTVQTPSGTTKHS